jgi:hypothetical protein
MQINRVNKLSIKLGGFQILQFFGAATFVLIMPCFITVEQSTHEPKFKGLNEGMNGTRGHIFSQVLPFCE